MESKFSEVKLNQEIHFCSDCAADIIQGLKTSRSGITAENQETLEKKFLDFN